MKLTLVGVCVTLSSRHGIMVPDAKFIVCLTCELFQNTPDVPIRFIIQLE
jgi:hypothetical protein